MTKTQIDRLGDRLKLGSTTEADIRSLDTYRESFAASFEHVIATIRKQTGLAPTGRRVKTTASIVAKLLREHTRLSRMQDIAGCRLIIEDINSQNRTVDKLSKVFSGAKIVDRRLRPSNGYRAVHVIAEVDGKFIEIQVRTALQHVWAEFSEKLAEVTDQSVKYGGGTKSTQTHLKEMSDLVSELESLHSESLDLLQNLKKGKLKDEYQKMLGKLELLNARQKRLQSIFRSEYLKKRGSA